MSEGHSWGSTVLGWFVVREGSEADAAAAMPEAGASPPPLPDAAEGAPAPPAFSGTPPPAPGGKVDFDAVFDAAGIAQDARGRMTQAGDLLASLPAETPLAVKKQIVEASLKAFGVPIDKIIEAGVEEIQALEGYIRVGATDTQKLLDESSRRIAQYEDEIRKLRTVMDERVHEQQSVTAACNARKLDVQRVLEFFGQDAVARVVRDSPKLVDPSAPPSP